MSIKHHFFPSTATDRSVPKKIVDDKAGFTDVGDTKDCGFRAIAAGLIDLISRHHLIKGKEQLLTTLLTRHESIFKPTIDSSMLTTSAQKMQKLITKMPREQLIPEIAFTLRQIAVDELCANPTHYPGAFTEQSHQVVSPEKMRHSEAWIDESCIAALSNRLHLPITIHITASGKDIPVIVHYHSDKTMPCVLIKQEQHQYIPYLYLSESRKQLRHTANWPERPPNQTPDPSLHEIRALITNQNTRMIQTFKSICHDLKKNLETGILKKSDLLAIYIQSIKDHDDVEPCASKPLMTKSSQYCLNLFPPIEHKNPMIRELIYAIASAISTGHMSRNMLYCPYDETTCNNTHTVSSK